MLLQMKNVVKIFAVLLSLVMLSTACAGSGTESAGTNETEGTSEGSDESKPEEETLQNGITAGKPYDGTELTFLICCETAAQFRVWRDSTTEFEELTGIKVNFTDDPLGGLREKFVTESISNPGSIDVAILFDTWLLEQEELLEELPGDVVNDVDLADFPVATADLGQIDGTQYGIPVRSHVQMFFYREDVLAEMGLTVPESLDELVETARVIDEEDNGMSGFVLNWGKQSSVSPMPWIQLLEASGADVFDDNGQPVFDSPEAIEATKAYQELISYAPDGAAAFNEADMRDSFATGNAAMTFGWSWSKEVFDKEEFESSGNTGFVPSIPGANGVGQPLAMAWPMVVSKSSENKEAAMEWIRWVTSPELDVQAISDKSDPEKSTVVGNRISSLVSESANTSNDGYSQAMAAAYAEAEHQPIYPEFSTVTEIIETMLSDIVSGDDVETRLKSGKDEVEKALN